MKQSEQILTAMSGIGEDLVTMAELQQFERSVWQRVLPVAACLLIVIGGFAGLKKLPAQPIYSEPPTEVEPPTEPETPPEPVIAPEEPAEEPAEIPHHIKELETPAFYIFDMDDTTDKNPSKAIAPDGTVLVSVEQGQIEPLIDQATGEYMAIMVYHRSDGQTIHEATYDIYNLEGENVVTGLQAYAVDCLGDVILVLSDADGEPTASLYRRDTYAMLRSNFISGIVVGNCIWLEGYSEELGAVQYVVDAQGAIREVPKPIDNYYVWNDRTYFVTKTAEGMGLLDSDCNELLSEAEGRTIHGISNGYARCEDKDGYYLIDVRTGEEVFRWEHYIKHASKDFITAESVDVQELIMWDGHVVATGNLIRCIARDNEGNPTLYAVENDTAVTFIWVGTDGSLLTKTMDVPFEGELYCGDYLSNRTSVCLQNNVGNPYLLDLMSGTLTPLHRTYGTTFAILEDDQPTGLFTARWHPDDCRDIPGQRFDIVREDGTVLLEGLTVLDGGKADFWTRQGDAFYTETDSMAGLIRIDGTWIYQEPL